LQNHLVLQLFFYFSINGNRTRVASLGNIVVIISLSLRNAWKAFIFMDFSALFSAFHTDTSFPALIVPRQAVRVNENVTLLSLYPFEKTAKICENFSLSLRNAWKAFIFMDFLTFLILGLL